MITQLINKKDSFQIVGERIAEILKAELTSQLTLAQSSADITDTTPWDLRVFRERTAPWDEWNKGSNSDERPIVSVWFDRASIETNSGGTVARQMYEGLFNIDIVALGAASDTPEGHRPGDLDSALKAHDGAKLMRNILMASEYNVLSLRGVVGQRLVNSITSFKPTQEGGNALRVHGMRLVLQVRFNEFSPQYEACPLEGLAIELHESESGELLSQLEYITAQEVTQ